MIITLYKTYKDIGTAFLMLRGTGESEMANSCQELNPGKYPTIFYIREMVVGGGELGWRLSGPVLITFVENGNSILQAIK